MNDTAVLNAEAMVQGRVLYFAEMSDRKKHPTLYPYRRMTEEEVRGLVQGERYPFTQDHIARVQYVKITSIKTWKRKPDVLVGVKHGLRDTVKWTLDEAMKYLLVPLFEGP